MYGVSAALLSLALPACSEQSTVAQPPTGITPTVIRPTQSAGSPSATTSTSPSLRSSEPTGVRPDIPAAARAHTSAGAEAFAMNYFAEVNRAWTSANAEDLRWLATPRCKTCANFVATADSLRAKGQRYAAPAVRTFAGVLLPETTPNRVVFQIPTRQQRTEVVDRTGRTVRVTDSRGVLSEVAVVWQAGRGWRIDRIKIALSEAIQ